MYVHTALWEAAPYSTIEAAHVGTPVLSRAIRSMASLEYFIFGDSTQEMIRAVRTYFNDQQYAARVQSATDVVLSANTQELMAKNLRSAYEALLSREVHAERNP